MVNAKGKIIRVSGQIAEVLFLREQPKLHDILFLEEDPLIKAEIRSASLSKNNVYACLILSRPDKFERGATMVSTGMPLEIHVGSQVLGRVLNGLGSPIDGKGDLLSSIKKPIYGGVKKLEQVSTFKEIIETGIKVLDFFCPILRGGKIGILGGAGVGKTITLTEILYHIMILNSDKSTSSVNTIPIFAGVGERTRESQELIATLDEKGIMQFSSIVLGSMGEHAGMRFLAAQSAATIAEYFRDDLKTNVLFFMDNAFRFAQSGNELAMMMHMLPSEDGYQPTLFSELSCLHERLNSSINGAITTIEAVYIPNDDILDQAVQSIFSYLDSAVVFSRDIYQRNLLPAVDILSSTSNALTPEIVGEEHYQATIEASTLLRKAASLEKIVSLVGKSEISPEDRTAYERATQLRNFMTQNLFVLEAQMGIEHPGKHVSLKETIKGVRAILDGKLDNVDPDTLLYIGDIGEAGKIKNGN